MPSTYTYDGMEGIQGISGMRYDQIPSGFCQNAVNRAFRFGINAPRNPFHDIQLTFANQADQFLFEGGNVQGAFFYESYPTFENSYLFVSIAGTIFQIQLTGNAGTVTRFFDGNDPTLTHAWFVQGFNWMVIQDGIDLPIVWDGTNPPRRSRPASPDFEIPVGSVMAFNQGYIIVCSSDGQNQLAASNQIYSTAGQTGSNVPANSTQDLITFSYQGPGQNPIGTPIFIGDVNGLFSMPYLDTGTGQNELLVVGTDGVVSIDLSGNRDTWIDTQIIRISLIGIGCYSSHSLCSLNGDLFFRNTEGVYSYRNSRLEFQSTWNQAPISLDVRQWLDQDRPDLVQYNSQIAWNNYLFSTIYPVVFPPNNPLAGFHRCHKGLLAMDCEPESTVSREGAPKWNGIWTGIRPTAMIEGRINLQHRAFAFSYDIDGKNRLYEFCRQGQDDIFQGSGVRIQSILDSRNMGAVQLSNGGSTNFDPKIVGSVEVELSNIKERVDVSILLKPDSSPCYVAIDDYQTGCSCYNPPEMPCFTVSQPQFDRRVVTGLDTKCLPGNTGSTLNNLRHWQTRIEMTGYAEIERLRWSFTANERNNFPACSPPNCNIISCCPYGDFFTYSIAPPGSNPNVPFIPTPSDVAIEYNSVQFFNAQCPDGSGRVTGTGSASSEISQADADSKAFALAQQNAIAQLKCSSCTPQTLIDFTIQNSTFDLSSFFVPDYNPTFANRVWRLIDEQVLTVYASGYIDLTGTLQIFDYVSTGPVVFNPIPFTITDTSGTLTPVALEVGCPTSGDTNWPTNFGPYY